MRTNLARLLHRAPPWRHTSPIVRGLEATATSAADRTIRPGFQRRYRTHEADGAQRYPLDGYYADILSRPLRTTSDSKPSLATNCPAPSDPQRDAQPSASPTEAAERRQELDRGARVVAGIKIPPRPEEPDDCCMSGCVNCVWDLYRDELEEWAAASAEAKKKMALMGGRTKGEDEGRGEVMGEGLAAVTGDLPAGETTRTAGDEGVKGTNVTLDTEKGDEDLMSGIPVGMRAFMLMEKALKQKQSQEKGQGG